MRWSTVNSGTFPWTERRVAEVGEESEVSNLLRVKNGSKQVAHDRQSLHLFIHFES